MPKSEVPVSNGRRSRRRSRPVEASVVQGQIVELCRELAVQAKRMQQLQEQAEELRAGISLWAGEAEPRSPREPVSRGGRR